MLERQVLSYIGGLPLGVAEITRRISNISNSTTSLSQGDATSGPLNSLLIDLVDCLPHIYRGILW